MAENPQDPKRPLPGPQQRGGNAAGPVGTGRGPAAQRPQQNAGGAGNTQENRRPARGTVPFYSEDPTRRGRGLSGVLGQWFYTLGLGAETRLLMFWRAVRNLLAFVLQLLGMMFKGMGRSFASFFKGIGSDVAEPFTRQHGNKRAAPQRRGSLGKRIAVQFVALLLPLLGIAALTLSVYGLMGRQYALAVEVDGEIIGYVADESVVQDARAILRDRIRLAPDQSIDDWMFEPQLSVAVTSKLSNKSMLADEILRRSDDVSEGSGLYVNGALVGVVQDGGQLQQYLDGILAPYQQTDDPNTRVSFVKDISVERDGIFFKSSIESFDELRTLLEGVEEEAVYVTANGADTLGEIAAANGITLEVLQTRNPEMDGWSGWYQPDEGTQLLIYPAKHFLQVRTVVTRVDSVDVYAEPQVQQSDELPMGTRRTSQTAVPGKKNVVYEDSYIDGELTTTTIVREEILSEATPEIILEGTNPSVYGSAAGSGLYIWPVPAYRYISRGFLTEPGHMGIDIVCPEGTAVYAANEGTVITSEYSSSYGYYIVIEHADGVRSLYGHNSSLLVNVGDAVGRGQAIALSGNTGWSTGPHCHFEIILNGSERVEPLDYIGQPPHGFELVA